MGPKCILPDFPYPDARGSHLDQIGFSLNAGDAIIIALAYRILICISRIFEYRRTVNKCLPVSIGAVPVPALKRDAKIHPIRINTMFFPKGYAPIGKGIRRMVSEPIGIPGAG